MAIEFGQKICFVYNFLLVNYLRIGNQDNKLSTKGQLLAFFVCDQSFHCKCA